MHVYAAPFPGPDGKRQISQKFRAVDDGVTSAPAEAVQKWTLSPQKWGDDWRCLGC
jgi:hypothetical protein